MISCFPADIPEFISVDLSGLKKGSSLHVKDITLPKGVKFVAKGQVNPVLVSVTPIVEEVAAAPVADASGGKDAKAAAGKASAAAKDAAKAPAKAPAKPAAKK